jgi:hypothetical protein
MLLRGDSKHADAQIHPACEVNAAIQPDIPAFAASSEWWSHNELVTGIALALNVEPWFLTTLV